ncbi:MAG: PKD domain-containing protein [Caldilineaceae bacterium]
MRSTLNLAMLLVKGSTKTMNYMLRRYLLIILIAVVMMTITSSKVSADPTPPFARLPILGDQDGSETPLVLRAPGFEMLPEVQTFRVAGEGIQEVTFDFVYRQATYNNEFGFIVVDNLEGTVNGRLPGDPDYLNFALARARVVFPSGSDAYTPDVTVQVNGGDILMFFIVQANTLQRLKENNPDNLHSRSPLAFFSLEKLNPDGVDHFVGFRNASQDITQFGFEDMTNGGDRDYDDITYNIKTVLLPSPLIQDRDIILILGIDSEGRCNGFHQWVPEYFDSQRGKDIIGGRVKIQNYYHFNYKGGGSYDCPTATPTPTATSGPSPTPTSITSPVPGATPVTLTPTATPMYYRTDTCDGIDRAADELEALINARGTTAPKVTIVAHSMGGVVTAYLMAREPLAWVRAHIASVITFDSPHQGVPDLATWPYATIIACDRLSNNELLTTSLKELASSSDVIKRARLGATVGVPFFTLDATENEQDYGNIAEAVLHRWVVLDQALYFDRSLTCTHAGFGSRCEPPHTVRDDHDSIWKYPLTLEQDFILRQDKRLLVACAVLGASPCSIVEWPIISIPAPLFIDVDPGVLKLQLVSSKLGGANAAALDSLTDTTVQMKLVSADGTTYGPDGAGPVAAYAESDTLEVYEVANPAPGQWRVEFSGENIPNEGITLTVGTYVLEREQLIPAPPFAYAGEAYTGTIGQPVFFDATGSWDSDGLVTTFEWDFESDGNFDFDSAERFVTYTYPSVFEGFVTVRVTDNDGNQSIAQSAVNVSGRQYLPLVIRRSVADSRPVIDATRTPKPVVTPIPSYTPTFTASPTQLGTNTPIPPTHTLAPPTNTPVPPTNTLAPPTNTPVPLTNTNPPPTYTPVPPTNTPVPPTNTSIPPTNTSIPSPTPINQPPVVDAGPSQTIFWPAVVTLNGTVSDDGLPSGQLSISWHKVTGPGDVTFTPANQPVTMASFSEPGEYVLTLIVDDGALVSHALVAVAVIGQSPDAPSDVTLTINDSSTIHIAWVDNANNENGFTIDEGSTAFDVAANITEFAHSGLAPNSYHCYSVSAFNAYGRSAATDWLCATTFPAPVQIESLNVRVQFEAR